MNHFTFNAGKTQILSTRAWNAIVNALDGFESDNEDEMRSRIRDKINKSGYTTGMWVRKLRNVGKLTVPEIIEWIEAPSKTKLAMAAEVIQNAAKTAVSALKNAGHLDAYVNLIVDIEGMSWQIWALPDGAVDSNDAVQIAYADTLDEALSNVPDVSEKRKLEFKIGKLKDQLMELEMEHRGLEEKLATKPPKILPLMISGGEIT